MNYSNQFSEMNQLMNLFIKVTFHHMTVKKNNFVFSEYASFIICVIWLSIGEVGRIVKLMINGVMPPVNTGFFDIFALLFAVSATALFFIPMFFKRQHLFNRRFKAVYISLFAMLFFKILLMLFKLGIFSYIIFAILLFDIILFLSIGIEIRSIHISFKRNREEPR